MPTKCQQEKKFAAMTICHCLPQYTTYMLSYQSESNGSCQKKALRGFEKPSFQEKTRFLAHILNMSESYELREARDVFFQRLSGHSQTGKRLYHFSKMPVH